MVNYAARIAQEFSIQPKQVQATIQLLDEGGTVPFISRYRKELTGSLDEVQVAGIRDRLTQLRELDKRREAILKSINEQEKLTDALEQEILAAETMSKLEDIYLPYKPKRKTKASMAREKGLEPLAEQLLAQQEFNEQEFVDENKWVKDGEEALEGARHIIAEWINEDALIRDRLRKYFQQRATIKSRVITSKKEQAQKYKDYFDWEEAVNQVPSHRLLAMRRGEAELFLMLDLLPEEEGAIELIEKEYLKGRNRASEQVKLAIHDAYKRLLSPSMETELRMNTKKKADEEAIRVFADNLQKLLMAAPMGRKRVMAIDPGFRTGCKLVCLDEQGKLLHFEAIYPNEPQKKVVESGETIKHLVKRFNVQAIAVGNGTAGRETEQFVRNLNLDKSILIVMVNESGASIYSASEIARNEFPDHDITVRGAVSIGRRLMDPLAELVKLDPKSIGVGQYQHDVDQTALKHSLDDVVMSCVNAVGVEVNTASEQLLTYVAGLGPQLASNIVAYRKENGPFKDRSSIKKVPRLGEKAFEQAAGFLRVSESKNPLDNSAVHPESYAIVKQMAKDLGCDVSDLMKSEALRRQLDPKRYITEGVGLPTLQDILAELAKPGRDPREQFEAFEFAAGVIEPADLRVGMKLPGIVTNVTNFGAFVDVGVHQDGLVHVSQLANKFVSNPAEVVSVQQQVMVTVTEVDLERKRISLSMKDQSVAPKGPKKKTLRADDMQSKLQQLKGKFGQ